MRTSASATATASGAGGSPPLLVLLDGPADPGHVAFSRLPVLSRRTFASVLSTERDTSHADRMLDVLNEVARREPCSAVLAHGTVLGASGHGSPGGLARGLRWAARQRAAVVAVPLGLLSDHPLVRAAINDALDSRIAVVAAVGNPCAGLRAALYPAAYPGVVAVGAAAYATAYASWETPPDEVVAGAGTSEACVVAAWRRVRCRCPSRRIPPRRVQSGDS